MPSVYLQAGEYAAYGVPAATAQQVTQASLLIDSFLKRPEGLIYVADANGNPCYMAAMNPGLAFTAGAAFAPGVGVVVPVSGPLAALQVGDCVVLDRTTDPGNVEAVQVTSIDTVNKTLTLGSSSALDTIGVQFNHGIGCSIETGLILQEQKYLPKQRSEVMLSFTPVMRIVGGTGRYAYGRRGDDGAYNVDNYNLLASLQKFGGPPAWEIWPANAAAGIDSNTGQLWVPAGIMLAYYSEVKVRYVCGFSQGSLPPEVKQACAMIIQSVLASPAFGDIKSYAAGDTKIEQFASSALSADVKALLARYRAHEFA